MPRPSPFDLVFGSLAPTTFPAVRAGLGRAKQDARNRDAFLMVPEVITLVRDLRPEEGLGEGIDQLTALIHLGYLFWEAGSPELEVTEEQLRDLLTTRPSHDPSLDQPAFYARLPERRVWAQVVPDEAYEPLDGCFLAAASDRSTLRVLGVFGIHSGRAGFSVVEVSGPRPSQSLARPDHRPLFSSTLPGGEAAGLFSLAGEEELLELGWRIWAMGTPVASAPPVFSSQLPAPSS